MYTCNLWDVRLYTTIVKLLGSHAPDGKDAATTTNTTTMMMVTIICIFMIEILAVQEGRRSLLHHPQNIFNTSIAVKLQTAIDASVSCLFLAIRNSRLDTVYKLRFKYIAFQFKLQEHVQGSVSNTIVLTWKISGDKLKTENTLLTQLSRAGNKIWCS